MGRNTLELCKNYSKTSRGNFDQNEMQLHSRFNLRREFACKLEQRTEIFVIDYFDE